MASKKQWHVDLPDPRNLRGAWVTVATFDTRREAREFCKENGLSHGGLPSRRRPRPGVIELITSTEH